MLDVDGLHLRAAFFRWIRTFFYKQGFLEVDTPLRQPVVLPESNIQPLRSEEYFLQSSPEQFMKRLLAAGNDKIFQMCHCFRKEERGRLHLEEFQMLEWYRTGADYYQLMTDCELLVRFLFDSLIERGAGEGNGEQFFFGVNLKNPWQRLTVADAFASYSPIPVNQALAEDRFDEILVELIEPHLGISCPVFLYDYPVELGSLARKKKGNPAVAERFELYINGVELANGFSELTDAREQKARFTQEISSIKDNGGGDVIMPERFLADLEFLDCAAGIAVGVDRLLMTAINRQQLKEVVTFVPEDFL